jgi:hypothetical protein
LYDILYGWFETHKNWLFQLEEAFMALENWQYTKESILVAESNKGTTGKRLKGCVAQLIAYVKVDLVNQIRDSGVKTHGMNITKSRPKDLMPKTESGKYVRRKKGEIFLTETKNVLDNHHTYQQKKGISDGGAAPDVDGTTRSEIATTDDADATTTLELGMAKMTKSNEQAGGAAPNVDATTVSRLSEVTPIDVDAGTGSVAATNANNAAVAKEREQSKKQTLEKKKGKQQQKKIASPEPIYIESEYELKRKQRIKQNEERLKSLGLDRSIGQLAKEMDSGRNKKGRKTKKSPEKKSQKKTVYNVEKFVSHRVGKKRKYELFTKWEGYSSDENTWEDAEEKLKEIPIIVCDYLSTIDNNEFEVNPELRKLYDVSIGMTCERRELDKGLEETSKAVTQEQGKKRRMDEKDSSNKEMTEQQNKANEMQHSTSCQHRDHDLFENFLPVTNAELCKEGKYCHGRMCRKCNALFDDKVDGDVEGQLFVKPSKKNPVWVCVGLTYDMDKCKESLCNECAKKVPNYSKFHEPKQT